MFPRYTPKWSVHQVTCSSEPDTPEIPWIFPDVVFLVNIGRIMEDDAFSATTETDDEVYQSSLTASYNVSSLEGYLIPVRIPILIVEYVKTSPGIASGASLHLAHLAMCMKTAIGLRRTFLIEGPPVFGLLVDRFHVTVVINFVESRVENCDQENPIVSLYVASLIGADQYLTASISHRICLENSMPNSISQSPPRFSPCVWFYSTSRILRRKFRSWQDRIMRLLSSRF